METQTITAGAAVRRFMRVWLAELDLEAEEFKGVFESAFVVKIRTAQDRDSFRALEDHISDILAARLQRELRIKAAEDAAKLKKVNFWRKATFRKQLTRLV